MTTSAMHTLSFNFTSIDELVTSFNTTLERLSEQTSPAQPPSLQYQLQGMPAFQINVDFECLTTYLGSSTSHFAPYGIRLSFSRQVPLSLLDRLTHAIIEHHFMLIKTNVL